MSDDTNPDLPPPVEREPVIEPVMEPGAEPGPAEAPDPDASAPADPIAPVPPPQDWQPSWTPPPPPAPPAGDQAAAAGSPDQPGAPRKKRGALKIAGAVVGLAGLVAGGAFAYTQITGGEQANTPEEAVETFLHAFETGDAIGMAKLVAPGERDVMLDSIVPMVGELSRLEILDKDLDLNKVPGYEATISNFKATSKPLRADLAEVSVTGGTINTRFDPKQLPLGAFVKDLMGSGLDDAEAQASTDALTMDDDSTPLVVQKVGKRWYLSLNYTIAEAARRDSATPFAVPAKGAGVPAKGAASAEAAVSEMLVAAGRFDVRRMIELLPPDEFAALHDYAGQFIDDAEAGIAPARDTVTLDLAPKLASSSLTGDRALVTVIDLPMKLSASMDGNTVTASYADKSLSGKFVSDQGETVTAEYAKNCLTLDVDGDSKQGCGQEGIAKLLSDLTGQEIDTSTLGTGQLGLGKTSCASVKGNPKLGFVAVKRDGAWYVSPMRTWFDSMSAVMKQLDRKDLDCIKKQIEDTMGSLQGVTSPGATDPTFEPPLDPDSDPFTSDTFPSDTFPSDTFPPDTSPPDTTAAPDTVSPDTVPPDTVAFG